MSLLSRSPQAELKAGSASDAIATLEGALETAESRSTDSCIPILHVTFCLHSHIACNILSSFQITQNHRHIFTLASTASCQYEE